MKNYFFAADTARKAAMNGSIEFCEMEIDGVIGVVVDQENFNRALQVLGARKIGESISSIEGIANVILDISPVEPLSAPSVTEVKTANYEMCRCDHWKTLLRRMAEWAKENVIGVSVTIHYGYENTPFQLSDGLNIVLGATVEGVEDSVGVKYQPGGRMIGFTKLPDCPENSHFKMITGTLSRLLPILLATGDEVRKIQQRMIEEGRKESRASYIKECSRRFEKTVVGTKEAVAKGHADIAKLQQELTRRIRETHGAERKLEQIESLRGTHLASYGREFDSLLSIPGVENVETGDGVIKVFTENIYITPDRCADTYDIGKFRIEIYTSGSNGGIRFFNLTRKGETTSSGYGVHHPHVNGNGYPCLGNIKEMVPQLIGEAEYSAVAQLGLQYLKSVNTEDSAGRTIFENWPKKNKEIPNGTARLAA